MKKVTLLFALALIAKFSFAQSKSNAIKPKPLINDTIIKDANGRIYSREERLRLTATGRYLTKPSPDKSKNEVIIYELTAWQKQKTLESVPHPSLYFKKGESFDFSVYRDIYENVFQQENLEEKIVVVCFLLAGNKYADISNEGSFPVLNELVTDSFKGAGVVFLAITTAQAQRMRDFTKIIRLNLT